MASPADESIAKLTGEQKLQTAMRIYWSARALKSAALRAEHPE